MIAACLPVTIFPPLEQKLAMKLKMEKYLIHLYRIFLVSQIQVYGFLPGYSTMIGRNGAVYCTCPQSLIIIFLIRWLCTLQCQGGRGHWAVYYTSLQSLIITFSYSFNGWEHLLNFDWLVHLVECPKVSTTKSL